jgi:hypothetical protein
LPEWILWGSWWCDETEIDDAKLEQTVPSGGMQFLV